MTKDNLSPDDRELHDSFFEAYREKYTELAAAAGDGAEISLDACTVHAIKTLRTVSPQCWADSRWDEIDELSDDLAELQDLNPLEDPEEFAGAHERRVYARAAQILVDLLCAVGEPEAPASAGLEYVKFERLKPDFGIPYSSVHLRRLEIAGKFPRRVSFGDGRNVFWIRKEIEAFIESKIARRSPAPRIVSAAGVGVRVKPPEGAGNICKWVELKDLAAFNKVGRQWRTACGHNVAGLAEAAPPALCPFCKGAVA